MIVKLYTKHSNSPVEEYLERATNQVFRKISKQIKYLQEYGLRPEVINLKKLKGCPIWEIRILGKNNIHLLCSQVKNIIWILHIFAKKTMNTPSKDLNIALKRFNDIVDN